MIEKCNLYKSTLKVLETIIKNKIDKNLHFHDGLQSYQLTCASRLLWWADCTFPHRYLSPVQREADLNSNSEPANTLRVMKFQLGV